MTSKEKITKQLLEESKDLNYSKEDRKRYDKIHRLINRIPVKTFNKLFLRNKEYNFYKGFCVGQEFRDKEVLTEIEFDILQAVISYLDEGYYKRRKL